MSKQRRRWGTFRRSVLVALAAGTLLLCLLRVTHRTSPTPTHVRDIAERFMIESGLAARAATASPGTAFTETGADVGLLFSHQNGATGRFLLPELLGPGVGLLDYDDDDDLDVFVAGGGDILDLDRGQSCRLFRNDGGVFTDVTSTSGAGIVGPAYGVACADVDNDGDEDIYVTRLGPNRLLRNDGDGTFAEIGSAAGVDDAGFGASATFFDFDRDGLLDLYVTNYVDWTVDKETACYSILGERDYCSPSVYEAPGRDVLYRNTGEGRFLDVTDATGIDREHGQGLGVVASDFDGDGWIDLFVANDQTPGILWRNREGMRFENQALLSGCAFDTRGVAIAGMGVACEDIDGDLDLDLIVTNIRDQMHLALRNDGGFFDDSSTTMGFGGWSIPATGFGIVVFDQDHDGGFEAFIANGHVVLGSSRVSTDDPYAQRDQLMRIRDGQFVDDTSRMLPALDDVSRAAAQGDIDGDGDIDLVVTVNNGVLRLLRNECETSDHWLIVDTHLATEHRRAIGARIVVETSDRTLVREIRPQSSYLSSSDPRAHFGLGSAGVVDRITVVWPNGQTTERRDVTADQVLVIESEASP